MSVKFHPAGKNRYKLEMTPKMKAEAIFYAKPTLLPLVTKDRSLEQLQETAELPYLVSPVLGMPDIHEGYGIPVGGVMASGKIVSAGCVGMDINCGIRLLRTNFFYKPNILDQEKLRALMSLICQTIPIGLGGRYSAVEKNIRLEKALIDGAKYLVSLGFGQEEDLEFCEEHGRLAGADPSKVSPKAIARAGKELGTLGSGNHFIEFQIVDQIFNPKVAAVLGLEKGVLTLMIHSGSRALGHQTCLDYVERFFEKNRKKMPELVPNHHLASALIDSQEGSDYLAAMAGAINFAFANRQMITHLLRHIIIPFFQNLGQEIVLEEVYDVAHNSAKWENHFGEKILVHRKGATRAFPAYYQDLPEKYRDVGQPVLVPGSMGTASYVLIGQEKASETFFSVNHGAGRAMSRSEAKKTISQKDFNQETKNILLNQPYQVIVDEAPHAYKNIEEVIGTLEEIDLVRRVVRLKPIMVIKGN